MAPNSSSVNEATIEGPGATDLDLIIERRFGGVLRKAGDEMLLKSIPLRMMAAMLLSRIVPVSWFCFVWRFIEKKSGI
ncbi:hypothetical protein Bpfe_011712 [Biomphalaria pfeifferi]|uniref:Uncharacterized protein n=1 Tax=Biomphalaria pfeifferi TaxID=112525 RepID=A0AAD8BRK5_BIOPF|nr:hypothetical protein Bpfe_011712 [Biomphalaria pfeifferi]